MKMKIDFDEKNKTVSCGMNYTGGDNFNYIAQTSSEAFDISLNKELSYIPAITMPPAIRYISPDHSVVVWERPPGYVPFQYTEKMQHDIEANARSAVSLRLPVPWQRYVMLLSQDNRIGNIFLFFAKNQLQNLNADPFCSAPILNFYANNRLCPASYTNIPTYEHTLLGAIEAAYDLIWNSGFNWDTILGIQNFHKRCLRDHPLKSYTEKIPAMYKFWARQPLSKVVEWNFPALYDSFDSFMSTQDLYHEYPGKSHDTLVKFIFAAQNAQNK